MKFEENQIIIAQTSYEAGDSLREASRQSSIPEATLRRYAKENKWEQGKWRTEINIKSSSIREIIKTDAKMAQGMTQQQKILTDNRILDLADLKYNSYELQMQTINLLKLANQQVQNIIINNPNGLYIKGESANGTNYGRTTEFIKDLTSAMPAVNTTLGLDKGLEINNNTQNNLVPTIRIVRKEDE